MLQRTAAWCYWATHAGTWVGDVMQCDRKGRRACAGRVGGFGFVDVNKL